VSELKRYQNALKREVVLLDGGDLRPCPFCGGMAAVALRTGDWGYTYAEVWPFCVTDGCVEGPKLRGSSDHPPAWELATLGAAAAAWWNTRNRGLSSGGET
jgi:hypothetical protein